ncbi:MAG: hypothetical protein QOJ27_1098, partial [Sphingomonadales bacterium]|nr:hypothetical protein [Sphingomonadales bacterium]
MKWALAALLALAAAAAPARE